MKFVIVTGMSGAGKSTAMKMMEDMGYFCIDNLPIQLLDKLIDFSNTFHSDVSKVAVGIDVRNGSGIDEIPQTLEQLRQKNFPYEILFLDAEDEVLVKRYKETRRNHPLAGSERINKGIVLEREKLQYLKDNADYIIDTSQLLTRELKIELEKIFVQNEDYKNLFITILSFGFKYGIPSDSDIVMDVRFLPNPYYVDGTEERHECGRLCLLYRWLQEVLPELHLPEEGFFHMQHPVFRNVLWLLFHKRCHLGFRQRE